jgi:hypothetical protein
MATRRQILTSLPATGAAFALGGAFLTEGPAQAQARPTLPGHFHRRGNAPSPHTIRKLEEATLHMADTRDLEEQERGLIARRADPAIMAGAGNVAFDISDYDFLNGTEDFDSIHPSTPRIARLNDNFCLYEVIPGICQPTTGRAGATSASGRSCATGATSTRT